MKTLPVLSLLGRDGVGKTALVTQLTKQEFSLFYEPTIEQKLTIQKDKLPVYQIYDTAGRAEFDSLRQEYVEHSDFILLVFAVTCAETFQYVSELCEQIRLRKPAIPIMIVGTKIDLKNRQVSQEEGHALAARMKCDYMEVSAKNPTEIIIVFDKLYDSFVASQTTESKGTPILRRKNSFKHKLKKLLM